MSIKKRRIQIYWAVTLTLTIIALLLINSGWQSSGQLHSLMETLATVLALFVGILALMRFYSRGDTEYLVLGAGFIGVALLDGYHTLVTSIWFKAFFPSDLSSLIPWSWLASRLFLSIVLLSLYFILKWESEDKKLHKISPFIIYSFIIFTTLCSFLFFAFVPLPSGYFKDSFFHRPEELIPGLIFALALFAFLKQQNWQSDIFSHWLILSIIINLIAQIIIMPYSSSLFDIQFDIAHLYKKLSYLCILSGLCISIFYAFKDIDSQASIRKKTQLSLAASEVRNRTIMNSLVDGLISINEIGIIENVNNSTCKLFGYSKLELLGKNIKILMPEPYHEEHDGYLSNYKKTKIKHVIGFGQKVTGKRKDGSTFPIDLSVSEMSISGTIKYSGIVRDDTERLNNENELIKAKDEAQFAAKTKSNFLASMSHEIRTPMNGVLGMVELLQDTPLNEQQKDIIKTISDSGTALLEIINDILVYSKVEAGKIDLELITFNLERTIYDVSRLLLVKAEEKGIELIFYFHTNCPTYVIGDAGKIRQIMLNLVGNAIKFTDTGEVVIEVSCLEKINNKSKIRIEVKDTGIGFDNSVKEKLFQSFTQADNSTSRKYGGTGLGLSICKRLVNLMQGTLNVDSKPGTGSTFWLEVDLEQTESPKKLEVKSLDDIRILIVDDNPINLKILRDQLNKLKMQVDESSNSQEVVEKIKTAQQQKKPYKLIIIDNLMPVINGANLGRNILACKSINNTQLILLTSATGMGDAAQFKEIGFAAYLTKPILSDLLYKTLSRVLGLKDNKSDNNPDDQFLTQHRVIEDEIQTQKNPVNLHGKILLVEDVLINQKVALGLMSGLSLEIDIANDGQQALDKFFNNKNSKNKYDLILMDCQMPVMDGFEATKKIRETDNSTPIIAVTANALSTDKEKCEQVGMSGYLTKPYNRQQLIDVLFRWLTPTEAQEDISVKTATAKIKNEEHDLPLNFDMLANMKAAIGAAFDELIPAYLQQSDEMIDSMLELLSDDNISTLERYAHSMKSSSLNVGAEKVSENARIIENMCRNNTPKIDIKTEIKSLLKKYAQAKYALRTYQQRGNDNA